MFGLGYFATLFVFGWHACGLYPLGELASSRFRWPRDGNIAIFTVADNLENHSRSTSSSSVIAALLIPTQLPCSTISSAATP